MISIDFETRSKTDLITDGVYNYATCPSTGVICMWYSVNDAEPVGWHPGEPIPDVFFIDPGPWYAWNATFERLIWEYVMVQDHGAPSVPLERWHCAAYMARCSNLPTNLGNAARCLRVEQQKSKRGLELIKLLSIPLADGTFCEDPALLAEMDDYCAQDVRAEMAVKRLLREPTEDEWQDYFVNERINDRGIEVDLDLCQAAQVYAAEEEQELLTLIEEVTAGEVTKARGENLKAWVVERLTPDQEKLLVKYRKGEKKLSLDKYNRERLLALDDLDPNVKLVVEASDFAQKSSVGKFRAMERRADPDDHRIRGAFMANGASQSGRYSSKGAQVHNFPRQVMDKLDEVLADLMDNIVAEDMVSYYGLPMMTILSRMLRPALLPAEGSAYLVSDWSAIEGRVAPWLCDGREGNKKLKLYRDNQPIYEIAAAEIYQVPVEDIDAKQRQIGKVAELSLQYGGGQNAFLGMARGYGVVVAADEANRIKVAWRHANPWAVQAWSQIENAAMRALSNPLQQFSVGRLTYFAVSGILCDGLTLFCQLPCGRVLTYPDARIEMRETPWGDMQPGITCLRAAFTPKADEKEWPRANLWGGLLFENVVQGTAASLLRHALRVCDKVGLPVVLHVHDEIVAEVPEQEVGKWQGELFRIMNTPPDWAQDLPLFAEVDVMREFGK